ncbi:hypothetical protein [Priestia endophytica]|uniref:hypothetical protein n=1 Tax=Priestia endophytica TaxID=135735 RepID=UPI001F5B0426|nr:hypothetical protein [Priestia endophytica]
MKNIRENIKTERKPKESIPPKKIKNSMLSITDDIREQIKEYPKKSELLTTSLILFLKLPPYIENNTV